MKTLGPLSPNSGNTSSRGDIAVGGSGVMATAEHVSVMSQAQVKLGHVWPLHPHVQPRLCTGHI